MLGILGLAMLTACTGPNAVNMVPDPGAQTVRQFGSSVRPVTVSGEQESVWGGPAYITPEQLHSAVVAALSQFGAFGSVDEGEGDLELAVIVRSQGQKVSMLLEYAGQITVTYRFTDASGAVVWLKTLESSGSSHAFAGATRTTQARERTVKANLTALLSELEKSWQ
jgi:hypothetical protein